jgi:hypothetical protein
MNYNELQEYFHKYRNNEISKEELGCAIHLWQRKYGCYTNARKWASNIMKEEQ